MNVKDKSLSKQVKVSTWSADNFLLLWKEWKVSFELWPSGYPNMTASILHLTTTKNGSRWASYGSRSPAIFFHKSKGLLVQTNIDENPYWGGYFKEAKIPLNR